MKFDIWKVLYIVTVGYQNSIISMKGHILKEEYRKNSKYWDT